MTDDLDKLADLQYFINKYNRAIERGDYESALKSETHAALLAIHLAFYCERS